MKSMNWKIVDEGFLLYKINIILIVCQINGDI